MSKQLGQLEKREIRREAGLYNVIMKLNFSPADTGFSISSFAYFKHK